MQFPNALEGVKKVYKAEILFVISGALAVVAAILALAGGAAGVGIGVAVGVVLLFSVPVLGIISFIMNIVGLNKAKKDDPAFRNALYATVIGIAASVLLGISRTAESVLTIVGDTLTNVCLFLSTFFVCSALIRLAKALGNSGMMEKGEKARSVLTTVYIACIGLSAVSAVFVKARNAAVITSVILLASAVLRLVAYVIYLRFLGKARTMLEA